jgi:hypothetical protein
VRSTSLVQFSHLRGWGLAGWLWVMSIATVDRIFLRSSTPFSMILGAHEEDRFGYGSAGQSRRRDESEAGRKEEKRGERRGEQRRVDK